jgi:outer membrane protein assembly factor BamB
MRIISFLVVLLVSHVVVLAQSPIQWKFETGDRIYSSPLIHNDKVYFGSGDNSIYALDKFTGELIWKKETEGAVHSSPGQGKGLIFVSSMDGKLYALDQNDGNVSWEFSSEGEKMKDLWDYYLSSPLFDTEYVYWASGDGHLYALKGESGELLWKFKTDGVVHASPVISGNMLLIGSFDGNLYALNKNTGELQWKFDTLGAEYFPEGAIQKAVLVDNGVVYFGSRDYNLYALELKTGRCLWNYREPQGWIISTPLAVEDRLFFGTSDAHKYYCLDKKSGEILWEIPLRMRSYGNAVSYDGSVYFGTFDGWVFGVYRETGEVTWKFQTQGSRENYNKVYQESGEYAEGFELYGEKWLESEKMIHALGSVLGTPAMDGDTIYFGSSDGNIYAVKL